MEASREQSHCWRAPELWANRGYRNWTSSKRSQSDVKSDTHESRPLSPESHSSASFAFFDSTPPKPIGDFESNDGLQKRSSFAEGSTWALSQRDYESSAEGSMNPDRQSSEYRAVPAKCAAVTASLITIRDRFLYARISRPIGTSSLQNLKGDE